MANNVFQAKRTNVAGRTPNTTGSYVTNSQYISAGEFALNMADEILYTSNGSALITVGANVVVQRVTGNLIVNAIISNGSIGSPGQVLASNGSSTYWTTVSGTGTVTSVDSANGIAGGPITGSGTLYVLAGNSTVFVNASGVHVNTAALPGGSGGVYMKGGAATVGSLGSEGQNIFRVNANTLNNNTTIATGENAQATGPLAVASGITLTVESGARVAIV